MELKTYPSDHSLLRSTTFINTQTQGETVTFLVDAHLKLVWVMKSLNSQARQSLYCVAIKYTSPNTPCARIRPTNLRMECEQRTCTERGIYSYARYIHTMVPQFQYWKLVQSGCFVYIYGRSSHTIIHIIHIIYIVTWEKHQRSWFSVSSLL